jgi:two-component system, cell cycle sensor histidine kinase and response regulator CckA
MNKKAWNEAASGGLRVSGAGSSSATGFDARGGLRRIEQLALPTFDEWEARGDATVPMRGRESLLQAIFMSVPTLLVVTDAEGRILTFNPACEHLSGYQPDAMLGRSFFEALLPEAWHGPVRARLDNAWATGLKGEFECPVTARGGEGRHARWVCSVLRMAEGMEPLVLWAGFESAPTAMSGVERMGAPEVLRDYYEMPFIGMAITCPRTRRWLRVNDRLCEMLGYTREELLRKSWPEITHADDLAGNVRELERMLAGQSEGCVTEKRFLKKDGSLVNAMLDVKCVRRANRSVDYLVATILDITERKRMEEALAIRNKALEAAANAIVLTDTHGVIEWVNDAFCELTGYSRGESLGQKTSLLKSGRHDDAFYEGLWRTIRNGKVWRGEMVNRRKDGSDYVEQMTVTPVPGPEGTPTHFIAIKEDVSSRKVIEERLRESRARLANAQRIARLGDWEIDLTTRELTWSDEVYRIFGLNLGETVPTSEVFLECVPPEEREKIRQAMDNTLQTGAVYSLEHRIRLRDGTERVVQEEAEIERDEAGRPVRLRGTVQDVTERRQVENQCLRAQRMESIGSLASGIAHDLNNILAPIAMCAPMLEMELSSDERLQLQRTIEACTQRATAVVRQLLAFGRGKGVEKTPLQVRHLIREMARIARETFPCAIQVRDETPQDLWPLLANATQMHQVLLNLCLNARDAMPAGGVLNIQARNVWLDEHFTSMHQEAKPGPYVRIRVVDTGEGIPASLRPKVFDPFFTTKEEGKGSGLGLTTVLGIVKNHGGFITFQSELGRGTEFEIHLPAALDSKISLSEQQTSLSIPRGHGETILVVDDEPEICQAMRKTLERHGYDVMEAADGIGALALYARHQSRIAVVVTDLMMPLLDGLSLSRALRKMNPAVRILVSTGLSGDGGSPQTLVGLKSLGIQHVLAKPHNADVVLGALNELLAEHRMSNDGRPGQELPGATTS